VRLTPAQIEAIRFSSQTVFGSDADILLFGSRVDDAKRGGDIDLLIKPNIMKKVTLADKIHFLNQLEKMIGERKVDVVIEAPNDCRPIVRIARETGVLL